jgi:hypothetical protein
VFFPVSSWYVPILENCLEQASFSVKSYVKRKNTTDSIRSITKNDKNFATVGISIVPPKKLMLE